MPRIYADNAATTKISQTAMKAMISAMENSYGNPSSMHQIGMAANDALQTAREQIARCLGCMPKEIFFTSGGTESDNQAIVSAAMLGAKQNKRHIISTAFEHHAVLHTCASLEKEGFSVTDDAALLLARLSDGAMRDALSLLDQCVSHSREVTAEVVTAAAGLAGRSHIFELSAAVAAGDTAKALAVIDTLYRGSKDMERLCAEWVEHCRDIMIVKTVKDPTALVVVSAEELEQLKAAAAVTDMATVLHHLAVLQETLDRLRGGVSRRVEMEMAVLRLCRPELSGDLAALTRRVAALEKGVPPAPVAQATPAVPVAPVAQAVPVTQPVTAPMQEPVPTPTPTPAAPAAPIAPAADGEEVPFAAWGEVVEALGTTCPPLCGVLVGSTALLRGDIVLVCTDNDMFRTLVTRDGNKQILVNTIKQITGNTYRIGIKKKPSADAPNDPLAAFIRQNRERGVDIQT